MDINERIEIKNRKTRRGRGGKSKYPVPNIMDVSYSEHNTSVGTPCGNLTEQNTELCYQEMVYSNMNIANNYGNIKQEHPAVEFRNNYRNVQLEDRPVEYSDVEWPMIKMIDLLLYEQIEGDLFEAPPGFALAHCVAEDLHMSAGIAVEFKNRFKGIRHLIAQRKEVGEVAVLAGKVRIVYYLITKKESYGKPTMESLQRSLEDMRRHIKKYKVTKLAIPKIGCGLDRLDWDEVKNLVISIFKDCEMEIRVYKPKKLNQKVGYGRSYYSNSSYNLNSDNRRNNSIEDGSYDRNYHHGRNQSNYSSGRNIREDDPYNSDNRQFDYTGTNKYMAGDQLSNSSEWNCQFYQFHDNRNFGENNRNLDNVMVAENWRDERRISSAGNFQNDSNNRAVSYLSDGTGRLDNEMIINDQQLNHLHVGNHHQSPSSHRGSIVNLKHSNVYGGNFSKRESSDFDGPYRWY